MAKRKVKAAKAKKTAKTETITQRVSTAEPTYKNKQLLALAAIVLLVAFLLGSFVFDKTQKQTIPANSIKPSPAISATPSTSPAPSPTPSQNGNQGTNLQQSSGASLENIKYTLPTGWNGSIHDSMLDLHPNEGGGLLHIKAHNYDPTKGRRASYCQVVGYCTSSTYFTPMNIGNISGYMANGLDNSAGGPDYFGAKGNTLYIINSYNPNYGPTPNDFTNEYQSVLDSLVF